MSKRIRILMIEDDPMDAMMVHHLLSKNGLSFESKRVDMETEFRDELEHNPPDVILSDHGLPGFAGTAALAIAREQCPDTPFIFVTGRAERDLTMQVLNSGVTACVSKDRLSDLPPMIREAGRTAGRRRMKRLIARLLARLRTPRRQ